MSLFEARNVTKMFGEFKALDDVSISVPEQCIYGLLGPNGAGKTTLIRIINQITGPDSGELFLNGKKLLPDDVVMIGYLPEERGLYKKMKVGEEWSEKKFNGFLSGSLKGYVAKGGKD